MPKDSLVLMPGTSAAPLSLAALQAALPTGMYVERRDGALIVQSDRRDPRLVAVALVLALLADGAFVATLWWGLQLLLQQWTLIGLGLAMGVGSGAVPLTLFALARAFNTRTLIVDGRLTSSSAPVPWFGDRRSLDVAHLKRLFIGRSSNAVFGRPASALWWESDTGRRGILVDDLPDDAIAGLLEETIEEHLGLDGRGTAP